VSARRLRGHHAITPSRHHAITPSRHLAISPSRHLAISPSRHHAITPSRHLADEASEASEGGFDFLDFIAPPRAAADAEEISAPPLCRENASPQRQSER
jgi:hypothetical protein